MVAFLFVDNIQNCHEAMMLPERDNIYIIYVMN